jgi:hypothetical protein
MKQSRNIFKIKEAALFDVVLTQSLIFSVYATAFDIEAAGLAPEPPINPSRRASSANSLS